MNLFPFCAARRRACPDLESRLVTPARSALAALLAILSAAGATASPPVPLTKTVRFAPAPGPLDNPLKGWCTYTDAGPIRQPYSMVYRYVSWKELEPTEGRYEFAAWERRTWDGDPLAKGKRIVFRVYLDYPGRPSGVPDWLTAKGVRMRRYEDYGGGASPDYDDPQLVAGLERLIAALGARYDHNPRVAFVALGVLGFWGEWHTYPHAEWFASSETQRRIVDAYHRAFPDKILMGRYPSGDLGTEPWLGYHDDMFPADSNGAEDWNFMPMMRRSGRTENWRSAAIGGEMEPGKATQWLGVGFGTTRAAMEAMHVTWIGPYSPAIEPNQTADFVQSCQRMVRRMGYQFRLSEIRVDTRAYAGTTLPVSVDGVNEGLAPFYYPWPVQMALIRPDDTVAKVVGVPVDVRTWQPGDFHFAASMSLRVPAGRYRLVLGIIDPWLGRPAVAFANDLPRVGGWIVLTDIEVN
jgi:hypothetical protein